MKVVVCGDYARFLGTVMIPSPVPLPIGRGHGGAVCSVPVRDSPP